MKRKCVASRAERYFVSLMDRDLVRVAGRSEEFGRAYLYGTTRPGLCRCFSFCNRGSFTDRSVSASGRFTQRQPVADQTDSVHSRTAKIKFRNQKSSTGKGFTSEHHRPTWIYIRTRPRVESESVESFPRPSGCSTALRSWIEDEEESEDKLGHNNDDNYEDKDYDKEANNDKEKQQSKRRRGRRRGRLTTRTLTTRTLTREEEGRGSRDRGRRRPGRRTRR